MRARTGERRIARAVGIAGLVIGALAAPVPAQAGTTSAVSARPAEVTESAALRRAAEQCGGGEVCFWRERDYQGEPWRWMPSNGYRDMPAHLHDHVYSFYANASACFIDWDPAERRRVNIGDYGKVYDTVFGRRIDGVGPSNMC